MASIVPANTPLSYNLGINYESWEAGRIGYSITADLDQIIQDFKLIKTFHDAAVGTADPTIPIIDPTQQTVISYVIAHDGVQLVMGTNNNALASGGFGTAWSAGLMTNSAYTDQWVQMIIQAFGSTAAVKAHLGMILLGNEVDANGPPPGQQGFSDYQTWINQAFTNLQTSLANAGLGLIPISTTIANYGATNAIAVGTTQYIEQHWSSGWNNGSPLVLFNQYTQAVDGHEAQSTDYAPVISYFNSVNATLNGAAEPFVGETGYSTYYAGTNQSTVYQQIFSWLDGQYSQDHMTIPLFAFDAFDQPTNPDPVQTQYGIFSQNSSFAPTGLKPGITLPPWTATPIDSTFGTPSNDVLVGQASSNDFVPGGGDDVIVGASGVTTAIYWNESQNFTVGVMADHKTVDVADRVGSDGTDSTFNVQFLQFSDQTLDTTWLTKAASLSQHDMGDLVELYAATFDRAPDALGLDYWASRISDGISLDQITKSFFAQPEALAIYPENTTAQAFVTQVYNNVLGRAPDQTGLNYWVNDLQNGNMARDLFVLAVINGAQAPSGSSVDAQYLANKETVGAHFALDKGLGDVDWAKQVMAHVDTSAESVTAANQMTDAFAVQAMMTDPHLVLPLV